jgi:hypothetical protein
LYQIGEITRQETEDGYVFYGLPHSALADAYWEHGGKYRRRGHLPEYEDFLYDYAVSDTPNGLGAVLKARPYSERMLARIGAEGGLDRLMKNEQSIKTIEEWLWLCYEQKEVGHGILETIARKVEETDDLSHVFVCVLACDEESRRAFWDVLNHGRLKEKSIRGKRAYTVIKAIEMVCDLDTGLGSEICSLLNLEEIASFVNQAPNALWAVWYIAVLLRADATIGQQLLHFVDKDSLSNKLSRWGGFCAEQYFSYLICSEDLDFRTRLSNFLGGRLGADFHLSEPFDFCAGEFCISEFIFIHGETAERLWRHMDKKTIAEKLGMTKDILGMLACIERMRCTDSDKGCELCRLLDPNHAASLLRAVEDTEDRNMCLEAIGKASQEVLQKVLAILNE